MGVRLRGVIVTGIVVTICNNVVVLVIGHQRQSHRIHFHNAGQSAGSGSAKTIAPHAIDGDAGGSPTAAPPVADPVFLLQGKAASTLNKAQAIAAMERAGLPLPQGKEAIVPRLRKALQEWHNA